MLAASNGVFVSEDGATNWKRLLETNDHEYVRSIRQAPSDPKHLYATGLAWDMMGKYTYFLTQSLDAGKTWERHDVPLEQHELDLQLFAVHPKDPNILAVRAGGEDPMITPERLLISKDGGKTFTSPFKMLLLSQLAFNADGSKAWVVGYDGFFESTDGLATFNQIQPAISMSYVTERDGEVLAAGYYKGVSTPENGIGQAKAAQDGFTAYMQMNQVTQQVQCDPSTTTAMKCASWWADWERELMSGQFTSADGGVMTAGAGGSSSGGAGGAVALDAGVAGSAALPPTAAGPGGSDAGAMSGPKADAGCRVAAPGAAHGGAVFLGGLALLFVARRRRSRR
jgi:MYXO-CTERM domain-containing protein